MIFFKKVFPFIVMIALGILFYFLHIRICPFYNILKIPCPGCGMTHAFIEICKLDIRKSIEYNPLVFIFIFAFLLYIPLKLSAQWDTSKKILNKHILLVFIFTLGLTVLVEMININNPLLYEY